MARAARKLELSGVFASAITPHRQGHEPDFSASLDLLDFLAERGVRGICLLGAAGEFLDYTLAERQRIVYLGMKRSRVPVIAGVSHSTLAGAVELASEAISSGADALLLMPPFFYRYGQAEVLEFYREFAEETGDAVPVLLENLPQSTSKLEAETVTRLLDTGRFAGVSDGSGDWSYFSELLELKGTRPFALFCGRDRLAHRALRAGADGVLSDTASALPELLLKPELEPRLAEFLDWSDRFPTPVAIKRALELRGQKSGAPRTPLSPGSQRALADFDIWFRKALKND